MTLRTVLLALTLGAVLVREAPAVEVTGRLHLPAPAPASSSVDLYNKFSTDTPEPPPPWRGVVALMPRERVALPVPAKEPVIDQRNLAFHPYILPVTVGTRVRFTNSDDYFHNVFSLSPTKRFDLGRYPKGAHETVTFDKPGAVSVFCDIHAEMRAFVVILETPWFALTDESGAFRIADVPPGTYDAMIWHERLAAPARVREVTVRAGQAVDLELQGS
jgi:plastocyanin